jgi:Multicopper oxidase
MPTRRALLASALAAAIRPPSVGAQTSSAPGPGATAAPTTILELQRRTIEVNGKPASVFAIRQPDGTAGIVTEVGKPFRVRVENHIDQPSLIHWHGLGRRGIGRPHARPRTPPACGQAVNAAQSRPRAHPEPDR